MPLEPGTRLGSYEVLAPLGERSEDWYKASDTRRNQVVALRVLPAEFAEHPEMKARLERDTRTLSSLKHPQICSVVDVGHQDPATDFIVMDFVEGETLAKRLERGPMELPDVMTIAMAIADSLDKAHKRGVVHAGLNPFVVMLTPTGPRLLDFGVPKPGHGIGAADANSLVATRTSVSLLGAVPTFAAPYLAPEQFAGAVADARSDLFSFGAILYEMVTGRKAFEEKTQALLIAAVQTVEPEPASTLRPGIPPALEYIIARCLSKDPNQRLQTAFDVMSELQWTARNSADTPLVAATAGARKARDRAVWVAVAAAAVIAVALAPATLARFERAPEPEEARFLASSLPAGTAPITVSPDGRWVTSSINASGHVGLSLNAVTPQTLINGVPAQPFWSADSRSMAYFEDGKLKRADIGGGPPQIICDVPNAFSAGTWNKDGVILFPAAGLIQRVLAAGGQPAPITALDQSKQETEHLGPVFLPDGRRFLFLAASSQSTESAIYVGSLDSKTRTRLLASESVALYAAPGYLLFNRGDTVFAQAFDADKLVLKGEPIRVASGVPLRVPPPGGGSTAITRSANFAVSQTGVLAFRTGGSAPATTGSVEEPRTLVWLDRNGQRTGSAGPTAGYAGLDLAPDGKRLAFHRHDSTGGDTWVLDLPQDRVQRLTFDASRENANPVWSPDGTRIAFTARGASKEGLYVKPADGSTMEELLVESDIQKVPMSWSPDGKVLVYQQNTGNGDVWAVPLTGDKKPFPILQAPYSEAFPQVSPDGKWLAYQSLETGRPEIYVRPFPDGPGKWQVSTDGGTYPRWRRDGKELFFYFNNAMSAADIRVTGTSIEAGVPRSLFGLPSPSAGTAHPPYHRYAVSADGQRFLVSQLGPATGAGGGGGGVAATVLAAAEAGSAGPLSSNPVMVVLNWTQMLKEK